MGCVGVRLLAARTIFQLPSLHSQHQLRPQTLFVAKQRRSAALMFCWGVEFPPLNLSLPQALLNLLVWPLRGVNCFKSQRLGSGSRDHMDHPKNLLGFFAFKKKFPFSEAILKDSLIIPCKTSIK